MELANYEFMKFIQRLKYNYGDFKYLAVVQFQECGAVHYHMLANLDYIDKEKLSKIWGKGFIKINDIKNVDNVGAYIVKYMNKNIIDKRLMGKKAYFASKNLIRPEIIYEDIGLIECFKKYNFDIDKLVYENKFMSKENGMVLYYEFNKKRNNLI